MMQQQITQSLGGNPIDNVFTPQDHVLPFNTKVTSNLSLIIGNQKLEP